MEIIEANKTLAEACGVETIEQSEANAIYKTSDTKWEDWTIKDPRCREVVRERFKLYTTESPDDGWMCDYNNEVYKFGKTIAEAEIQCAIAIAEALIAERLQDE